jgi:hypothetical protein
MQELSQFCCQNSNCQHYGLRNKNNLTISGYYGKNKATRLLRCSICKSRFSENKGTVYFNSRLPKPEVNIMLEHIREGNGVRRTSRLCNHTKDTVNRYRNLAGLHAEKLHDELVAISP